MLAISDFLKSQPALTIICGHYGVGKTNLALNLVAAFRQTMTPEQQLTLVDMDIVNPYFRSSDSLAWLQSLQVRLLGPTLARSTLDNPSLAPGINEAFLNASAARPVIVDVGGDPDGARALARFAPVIAGRDYQMLYVANFNRPEVATAALSLAVMREIEAQAHLTVTALIGNTHLKQQSSVAQIIGTLPALYELAEVSRLPLAAIAVPAELLVEFKAALAVDEGSAAAPGLQEAMRDVPLLAVEPLVKTVWE